LEHQHTFKAFANVEYPRYMQADITLLVFGRL